MGDATRRSDAQQFPSEFVVCNFGNEDVVYGQGLLKPVPDFTVLARVANPGRRCPEEVSRLCRGSPVFVREVPRQVEPFETFDVPVRFA